MMTYIAILRGINVGGKRILKMADLKKMLEKYNFKNIRTYIQSGNVIFETTKKSTSTLASEISVLILKHFSLDVPTIVMTKNELENIRNENIFEKDSSKANDHLHITFLSKTPEVSLLNSIQENNFIPDEFLINNKAIYLYCPNSYSNSKLTNNFFEMKLKVTATTRNLKTVNELYSIAINQ